MKGKFLFAALSAALLMTACANDEITASRDGSKPDPNAIQFAPVVPYASRTVATTTDNIEEFITWAVETSGSVYMDGVTITKGESTWAPSGQSYYWPDENLTFYSLSPVDYTLNVSSGTPEPIEFTVEEEADDQVDFIYAVNVDEAKSESPVPVNFRHALSQIVFKAQNTDSENLKVVIEGVEVDGVAGSGTYTLPEATTAADDVTEETKGAWVPATDHTAKYVALTGAAIELSSEVTDLGSTPLYLIPQEDEGWDNVNDKTNDNEGSYFSVSCHLYRVLDTGEEITIWPTDGSDYAYVSVPVAVDWAEGYRYTYTIIFGEGLGYYPPDYTDPDDAGDPIPVLTPISFTVTVDEFQEVEKEVSMEAGDSGDVEPTSITFAKVTNIGREYYDEYTFTYDDDNTSTLDDYEADISDKYKFSNVIYTGESILLVVDGDLKTAIEGLTADFAVIDSEGGVFLFSIDADDNLSAVAWLDASGSELFAKVEIDHSTVRRDANDEFEYISMTIDAYNEDHLSDGWSWETYTRNYYSDADAEEGWTETIDSDIYPIGTGTNTALWSSDNITNQICSLIGISELTHQELHNAGWWTTILKSDGTLVEQGWYNSYQSNNRMGWFVDLDGYLDTVTPNGKSSTTADYIVRIYGGNEHYNGSTTIATTICTFNKEINLTFKSSVTSGSTAALKFVWTNGIDKVILQAYATK